jgi:class 3 adenylate cyclase
MTTPTRAASARREIAPAAFPWRALAAMLLAVSPTVILSWLLANPDANVRLDSAAQHFVITSNVSVVALIAGILVARGAVQVKSFPTLLVAVGFICMAGIFAVHGLATPGILLIGVKFPPAALVVGVSAQLALLVSAAFFAIRYLPLAGFIERRVGARTLVASVSVALLAYAVVALGWPDWFDGIARIVLAGAGGGYTYDYSSGYGSQVWGESGFLPYLTVGLTISLYGFAMWRQGAEFVRSRLPLQGALAFSYLLLAQAQVSQFLGPIYSLAWWEYHGLMLAAVAIAVGAIFVELDRRRGLERFLPPTVVERVISGDRLRLEGERRTVTILFADLRGSTALAERLEPEAAVSVLNTYLRLMARAVIDRGGILDKFLGDGLMAIFGVVEEASQGADAAAACALEIRREVARVNIERERAGEPVVGFGVGIHTGDVVLGAVGLPERSDYTALGDTVNTASRMESLCKELGVDVVISADATRRLRGAATRALGGATVRGKAEALEVFTLA